MPRALGSLGSHGSFVEEIFSLGGHCPGPAHGLIFYEQISQTTDYNPAESRALPSIAPPHTHRDIPSSA